MDFARTAVLAGGRLSQFKGHELALRAFHRVLPLPPMRSLSSWVVTAGTEGISPR